MQSGKLSGSWIICPSLGNTSIASVCANCEQTHADATVHAALQELKTNGMLLRC